MLQPNSPYNPEYQQNMTNEPYRFTPKVNMTQVSIDKLWLEINGSIKRTLDSSDLCKNCTFVTPIHKSLIKGITKKIKTAYIYKKLYFVKREDDKIADLYLEW